MSHVQNKTKDEILTEMAGTAQPGSQVYEQQKAAIIVRSTEDIQVALGKQTSAIRKVNTAMEELNKRICSLENTFEESSKSSGRVAFSLNILTAVLVLVGIAQVVVAYIK
ncbi:hypothetical protein IT774_04950 [Salinimonas marina]|uniref:Uncharacterized protein n=1 Tax=Salinimonas marina TaxID=2785918 RepID=A0A7S9DYX0_9ALTE|nr:hypothetical protein [Salinimonas marina]QPG06523.1 hypothetical protein IT774_04950 [Salinimonas marina]